MAHQSQNLINIVNTKSCHISRQPADILLLFITFMQASYSHVPETNHVSSVYNVAAILQLQYTVHVISCVMLNVSHFYVCTFRSMCAVPSTVVVCTCLIQCLPIMLLRYFLSDFEMIPVAPITLLVSLFIIIIIIIIIRISIIC